MGSALGAKKRAAAYLGLTLDEYRSKQAVGLKRCTSCREWKSVDQFCSDRSRGDGLATKCKSCSYQRIDREPLPSINPSTGRPGPMPAVGRDGDKKQARQKVNLEVREGRLAAPNSLPCVDCGHIWEPSGIRHEYDHFLGYAAEHHYDVEAVCSRCHHKREQVKRTHCKHGHAFTPENTILTIGGTRQCLACRRTSDRGRRDAAWWRAYREKRKASKAGVPACP